MFSSRPNFLKLRTNLRLCVNRLKLLEKKKAELALKARREISDYIRNNKEDRARIRVEHIIREDYLVEAMEIVEMYCDLLLARFGLIERMNELDPGMEEAVATIIWVAPRLSSDVAELKEVSQQLTIKYGREFAESCRKNDLNNVNEKVIYKLNLSAPPKILVENYMVEISRSYKVPFEPDPLVMLASFKSSFKLMNLIDFGGNTPTSLQPSATNAMQNTSQPTSSTEDKQVVGSDLLDDNKKKQPFNYPPHNPGPHADNYSFKLDDNNKKQPFNYPHPNSEPQPNNYPYDPFLYPPPLSEGPPAYSSGNFMMENSKMPPNVAYQMGNLPPYTTNLPFDPNADNPPELPAVAPNSKHAYNKQITWDDDVALPNVPDLGGPSANRGPTPGMPINPGNTNIYGNDSSKPTNFDNLVLPEIPNLPAVPSDAVGKSLHKADDVDFDDLARRFEELKKRK
ncbi:hypothetical protein HELRODRAFT_93398 [Helobdella robusta]|uniref:IST1 homolog n=1 Tax=Helobdella robusta TaxID=6412 RepID=T1G8V5_HELRO|nr:hypothetical protein HELRODRAFT_93398 [Helobdella robusta]ESO12644.1 hypothetical protein HELRODRAFT_93398 [Helobdella robusta]